jgi:hypothetical protein
MKIKKLDILGISTAEAKVYKSIDNKLYFNIKHGNLGKDTWCYSLSFNRKLFIPKDEKDVIKLNNNNYDLKVILDKNKNIKKDKKNNILYSITVNDIKDHIRDIILLWEIPNKEYINVEYEIKGNGKTLIEASRGKERPNGTYITPAPVIEITGDVELYWSGYDKNDNKISQSVYYNFTKDHWKIDDIKTTPKE